MRNETNKERGQARLPHPETMYLIQILAGLKALKNCRA
jgi:hypothetical protein